MHIKEKEPFNAYRRTRTSPNSLITSLPSLFSDLCLLAIQSPAVPTAGQEGRRVDEPASPEFSEGTRRWSSGVLVEQEVVAGEG